MTKILLSLGTGNRIISPAGPNWVVILHDRTRHRPEITDVWDLDQRPWPWARDSIHCIEAWSVLEHLKIGLEESLDECWRILKPGGVLHIKIPLWGRAKQYDDPTHRRAVSEKTFSYFDPDTEMGGAALIYGMQPWRLVRQSVIANRTSLFVEMVPRK